MRPNQHLNISTGGAPPTHYQHCDLLIFVSLIGALPVEMFGKEGNMKIETYSDTWFLLVGLCSIIGFDLFKTAAWLVWAALK